MVFFFFKHKTAYEVRISDWSSDVCSSDLFKPHERPLMPGSPATPDHPFGRRIGYFVIGVLLGLAGGFSNGLLIANLPQIQGALGLTSVEGGWLTAAYSMTNGCMGLFLIKFRQNFGLHGLPRVKREEVRA